MAEDENFQPFPAVARDVRKHFGDHVWRVLGVTRPLQLRRQKISTAADGARLLGPFLKYLATRTARTAPSVT
jgi:hypothetical protein